MLEDLNKKNKIIASAALVSAAILLIAGASIGTSSSGGSNSSNSKNLLPIPSLSNGTTQANAPEVIDQDDDGLIGDVANHTSTHTSSSNSHHNHH